MFCEKGESFQHLIWCNLLEHNNLFTAVIQRGQTIQLVMNFHKVKFLFLSWAKMPLESKSNVLQSMPWFFHPTTFCISLLSRYLLVSTKCNYSWTHIWVHYPYTRITVLHTLIIWARKKIEKNHVNLKLLSIVRT